MTAAAPVRRYFQVVACRKRNAYVNERGREVVAWHAASSPIVRYETTRQDDAEDYARGVYRDEGFIPEIYEINRLAVA